MARVRRQLQCDRPAQVVAMDADDSSDDSCIVGQQETTRRGGRTIRSVSKVLGSAGLNEGLQSLDCVSLVNVFEVRPIVMKTIPPFLKGIFTTALKTSLQEIRRGQHSRNLTTEIRGWKLFFLLPRILLHRPPRGGFVPKAQLHERVDKFLQGHWVQLLETSLELSVQGATASCRRRRGQKDTVERRATRAFDLCQLGGIVFCAASIGGSCDRSGEFQNSEVVAGRDPQTPRGEEPDRSFPF